MSDFSGRPDDPYETPDASSYNAAEPSTTGAGEPATLGSGDASGAGSEKGAPTQPQRVDRRGLAQLWIKVAGWLACGVGLLNIIAAFRLRYENDTPPLFLVGWLLMSAAYALAGKSLSEGAIWAFPIAALGCLLSFWFLGFLSIACVALVVGAALFARTENVGTESISSQAQLTHSLWLAGFVLIGVWLIFAISA